MVTFYSAIVKFLLAMQFQMSKPQFNHLLSFVHGIILCEGRKNVTQFRNKTGKQRHLSSMTNFLNHSPWCVNRFQRRRMQILLEKIQSRRSKKGDQRSLVFFIIDDTSCKKDSSTKRMEGLDYHFAHDDGKSVWSHCIVTAHLVSEDHSFAWDFRSYFRESYCEEHGIIFKSKNELAMEMIQAYPFSDDELVYVLADSWYTSKDLIDSCNAKGFHLIAAVRTNRTIYPAGIKIQISDFASKYIRPSDLRSVTVGKQGPYWIYEYEGPLADTENVKVLLSWENEFDSSKKPFCILCTDKSLDLVTILRYYQVRWNIETGYRYFKELLGFDQYQLQSYNAIKRFWAIQYLTYNFLEIQRLEWSTSDTPVTLGDVVRKIRQDYFGQVIVYVYEQALAQKPLKEVLKFLKLNA